ncbi:SCP-like protein [Oesophagostomum dentatum]|uniref:SCP-like protein n=1 Tax=Oesophagostomum dentatum TaxID=61180 RepID=A0A0B1TJY5_OESDE|nr:SCP-like protein [Oesophagostomum dentatum]
MLRWLPATDILFGYSFLLTIIVCASLECADQGDLSSMTPELRTILLAKHNSLRSMLALGTAKVTSITELYSKQASEMPSLNYSCELEKSAYYRASQCANLMPSSLSGYEFTENMRKYFVPKTTLEKAAPGSVQLWWSEITKLEIPIDRFGNIYRTNLAIDSFAKIASDLTTAVGCSIVDCGDSEYNFVCHYNTTLKDGAKLYNIGTYCTGCKGGVKNCANALCI